MDLLLLVKVAAVMLLLDGVWIYLVAGNTFSSMIQNIQGSAMKIRPGGAMVAYAAMILLFNQFITKESSGLDAFLLGFFIYGILETTNYTLLKKWDPTIAIIDTLWGGTLYAVTTYLTYKIMMN